MGNVGLISTSFEIRTCRVLCNTNNILLDTDIPIHSIRWIDAGIVERSEGSERAPCSMERRTPDHNERSDQSINRNSNTRARTRHTCTNVDAKIASIRYRHNTPTSMEYAQGYPRHTRLSRRRNVHPTPIYSAQRT